MSLSSRDQLLEANFPCSLSFYGWLGQLKEHFCQHCIDTPKRGGLVGRVPGPLPNPRNSPAPPSQLCIALFLDLWSLKVLEHTDCERLTKVRIPFMQLRGHCHLYPGEIFQCVYVAVLGSPTPCNPSPTLCK